MQMYCPPFDFMLTTFCHGWSTSLHLIVISYLKRNSTLYSFPIRKSVGKIIIKNAAEQESLFSIVSTCSCLTSSYTTLMDTLQKNGLSLHATNTKRLACYKHSRSSGLRTHSVRTFSSTCTWLEDFWRSPWESYPKQTVSS